MESAGKFVYKTSCELLILPYSAIVHFEADGNYTIIYTCDKSKFTITMQLGQVEEFIQSDNSAIGYCFLRIGRSVILNRDFIVNINVNSRKVLLSDARTFHYSVDASREALQKLKQFMEESI